MRIGLTLFNSDYLIISFKYIKSFLLLFKDLISRILDYLELRGIRAVDFFRSMDKTGRLMITKGELTKGLKTAGIPMRRSQVDNLFDLIDADGDGLAQYRDFAEIVKQRTHEEFSSTRSNYQWNH